MLISIYLSIYLQSRPEGDGSNSSEETEEDFTSITGLLRHLKNNVKRLREKTNELEDLKAEMKRTEHVR